MPVETTERNIYGAIRITNNKPRDFKLSQPSYTIGNEEASAIVEDLLQEIGPLQFFRASEDSSVKRMKAKAQFEYEEDARKAVPFSKYIRLTVQAITSVKLKITTNIYDVVKPDINKQIATWTQQHIRLYVYRNTDYGKRYTSLKLEGDNVEGLSKARETEFGVLIVRTNESRLRLYGPTKAFSQVQDFLTTIVKSYLPNVRAIELDPEEF
ncbi:uncharacterized protein K452DRAFT_312140 [Aplosporella prunicola CBS 121167]|uniref:Uncharacterized protein n=1 Tax=Aplosporella prunicola CBS 121167 TaxID=1176127 RepID=A0A6A6B151_9PEZI|nr:uncharacterized protein K452DRAFT_312140 [Aplosporella prunicola CBS 121167]KAF2137760.1 hypothetical protein K452DRAFT_312140 [Aplosporella prunicola CBS 121167]